MRMKLQTDYALRLLIYLATREGTATVAEIASCYRLSRNHLLKVARDLRQFGFVRTERGRSGGVCLALAADEINVGDVIRRMEDNLVLVECLRKDGGQCIISPCCRLTGIVRQALTAWLAVFDQYTLADLAVERDALDGLFLAAGTDGGRRSAEAMA